MSNATDKKLRKSKIKLSPAPLAPVSKKTNLELTPEAIDALGRLKENHGVNRTFAISRGVIMLEQSLLAREHERK